MKSLPRNPLIEASDALTLPCFDLIPAGEGDPVSAHWGGRRSDFPEHYPKRAKAYRSQQHLLSVDQALFLQLGLQGRSPLVLSLVTTAEDEEILQAASVSSGNLDEVSFKESVRLTARQADSLPPLEALLLYGGPLVQGWLSTQNLERWEYSDVVSEVADEYREYFNSRHPIHEEESTFARVGGWHIPWQDDDYYIPREMRLMVWTFRDAEPWYEVFLSPLRNHVIKRRAT